MLQRLGEVRPVWDRRIEVLVLTHPQQDHLAGLLPLLEREQVGLLILPRIAAKSDLFRAFV
jgi:competence protein ComEC